MFCRPPWRAGAPPSWTRRRAGPTAAPCSFTHDSELEGELPGGLVTARVFAGVVSADRRRACVDAEIPVSRDARPIEGARGDTLFVLDRRITAGERLETWIIACRLDTRRCDWLPTG